MNVLSRLFKNKDKKISIMISFALGILMLVLSNTLFKEQPVNDIIDIPIMQKEDTQDLSYESMLETRLEESLGQVYGVGQIRVMVRLRAGREIVVAEDYILDESITEELDSTGGTRTIENRKMQNTNIIISNNGTNEPLIIKELEPQIEGVIIIAEGGDDITVKDMLIRACESLLGIPTHKIQVLRMR